jgi:uncharacterized membrane protein YjjP (DUF1212 family)
VRTAVPGPGDARRLLDLVLGVGEVLLAGGVGASAVTDVCVAVGRAGGLRKVECDITFTSIAVSGVTVATGDPVTGMLLVPPREVDHTRVTAVHVLVEDLLAGRTDVDTATTRLAEVTAARPPRHPVVVATARAALSASVAVLLGAGWVVTAAAFVATVTVDRVTTRLGRVGLPAFFQNAAGGLLATSVALGLVAAGTGVRPALVVAGGIVLLLPGATLVGAVHDALTGFYVTAAARAFETLMLTAGIVSGIAVALAVGVRLGLPVRIVDLPVTGLADVPWQLLTAAVVAASFAVANRAPRRTLPAVALAGALGWAVSIGVGGVGLPAPLASAVAAAVIGAGAHLAVRRQRVPALVYTVAGIVPLLPGLAVYRGMRLLAEGDSVAGITVLGEAVTVGLSLAAGLFLGEALARPSRRRTLAAAASVRTALPVTGRRPVAGRVVRQRGRARR